MKRKFGFLFLILLTAAGARAEEAPKRILFLGDSYFFGEGVSADQNFPTQLTARLREAGTEVETLVIARTGWTVNDVIKAMNKKDLKGPFDAVAVLAGVNNHYQKRPFDEFKDDFRYLLWKSVKLAGDEPGRVVVFLIPDWGRTPFGAKMDQDDISVSLGEYNKALRIMTTARRVKRVDLKDITNRMETEADLTARDGLHPSGKLYGLWADAVLPEFQRILR